MSPLHRAVLKWARTIHLYLTLFALGLLLLFAVTGFMLNHEEWFISGEPVSRIRTGTVAMELLEGPNTFAIVEFLRKDYVAIGEAEAVQEDEDLLVVVFKRPGSRIEARIEREDGKLEVTYESWGLTGILLDLHRGKSTGKVWSIVIDAVCVVILIVATTGLILWSSLQHRGRFGLLLLGTGISTIIGLILIFVF